MRFGHNISHLAIPQWKQCYIDYEHLKIFIRLIKKIVQLIHKCEKTINQMKGIQAQQNQVLQVNIQSPLHKGLEDMRQIGEKVSQLFFDAHNKTMIINRMFLHMKLLETRQYFKKCVILHRMGLQGKQIQLLLQLVQFIYIQTSLLQSAKDMNLQGERKILKKYSKYADSLFQTPLRRNKKVIRISNQITKFVDEMQNFYVKNKSGSSKKNRDHLRELAKKIQSSSTDSFIFGSWIGICLTILGVLITILAYTGKSIETDVIFNRDFPTWRGIALFIIYIWILGINVYGFQTYSISHRIIFQYNQHHYSTSTTIFKIAGFFSTYFLIMFAIYTLEIAEIITSLQFPSYFLVLFVWGIFLLYLINPLPILSFNTRLYTIKLAFKSLFAPFFGVPFPVIWMTDQIISLLTPFKDLAYTICSYISLSYTTIDVSTKNCNSSSRIQVVFVVGAIAYICRILQCLRQGYDKGKFLLEPQFFNTIKYFFSLITLTLSFLWKAGNNTIFAVWVVFAACSTIYSYTWDVKIDWALFQNNSPNRFLRKNLCYPVASYYVIIIINFLFRIVWVFTLSPSIANDAFGSPQIFSLVTGTIQIFRRGIWNMLRVQRQHIANCRNFKATPTTANSIESLILQSIKRRKMQQKMNKTQQSFANLNMNETQNQEITKSLQFVKQKHLQILFKQIDTQQLQKIARADKCKQLNKKIEKIQEKLNIFLQKNIKIKGNKVAPQNLLDQ